MSKTLVLTLIDNELISDHKVAVVQLTNEAADQVEAAIGRLGSRYQVTINRPEKETGRIAIEDISRGQAKYLLHCIADAFNEPKQAQNVLASTEDSNSVEVIGGDKDDLFEVTFFMEKQ